MDRYEVSSPLTGVLAHFATKREAMAAAMRRGPGATVYDRLARDGARQLWEGRESLTTHATYMACIAHKPRLT